MTPATATESPPRTRTGGIAADQLRSIVSRIERLEQEKAELAADIKDVYAEAAGNGFCKKTIRQIVKLRKQDEADREEAEALLDLYKRAVGLTPDLFQEAPNV